jgi:hypothetical protein
MKFLEICQEKNYQHPCVQFWIPMDLATGIEIGCLSNSYSDTMDLTVKLCIDGREL